MFISLRMTLLIQSWGSFHSCRQELYDQTKIPIPPVSSLSELAGIITSYLFYGLSLRVSKFLTRLRSVAICLNGSGLAWFYFFFLANQERIDPLFASIYVKLCSYVFTPNIVHYEVVQ